jgi:hypothetical protein
MLGGATTTDAWGIDPFKSRKGGCASSADPMKANGVISIQGGCADVLEHRLFLIGADIAQR